MDQEYIERRITVGGITSKEFLSFIDDQFQPEYIQSPEARLILSWCLDYYRQYKKAPNRDIQEIFEVKKSELDEDKIDFIADVLEGMSEEYDPEQFNAEYLWAQTKQYFKHRHLELYVDRIKGYLDTDQLEQAEIHAEKYTPPSIVGLDGIYPFEDRAAVRKAFEHSVQPLFHFPGRLGQLMNEEFVREGFVNFLAPEKRGKSFLLAECGFRAQMEGNNVAFFQAGDMSEAQQIKRQAIWLSKRSYKDKYCKEMLIPVLDCIKNQTDSCDNEKNCMNSAEPPFANQSEKQIELKKFEEYEAALKTHKEYTPCTACKNSGNFKGTVWYRVRPEVKPLTAEEAVRYMFKWGKKYRARLKMATYSNESLTTSIIRNQLFLWEHRENFVPSVIIIDYADIMAPDKDCKQLQFREQENKKWQRLRAIAQDYKCLVITASQADAESYANNRTIGAKNFSEDKRKNAHVTAGFGLNQTDAEKEKGLIRINSYLARDNDFLSSNVVTVLQRLQIGRPVLGSF